MLAAVSLLCARTQGWHQERALQASFSHFYSGACFFCCFEAGGKEKAKPKALREAEGCLLQLSSKEGDGSAPSARKQRLAGCKPRQRYFCGASKQQLKGWACAALRPYQQRSGR